jgi:hypothetical protein
MTSLGIESATCRLLAQSLNQLPIFTRTELGLDEPGTIPVWLQSYQLIFFGFRQEQLYFSNVLYYYYYIPTTCFVPYGPYSGGIYILGTS